MIKLSIKERREQFQFFLALFIVTVALLSFGIFYSADYKYEISKQDLEEKIKEDEDFEEAVKMMVPIVDTTYKKIIKFNPNVQAIFLEEDIKHAIGSMKAAYDRKAADDRYKVFIQASQLYNILFYDQQEQKGNLNDMVNLQRSLDDCIISRRQLQQTLSTQ